MVKKLGMTFLLLLISTGLFMASFYRLPEIDRYADDYFTKTTTQAALAYATVRGVNGVVSVLKESQLSFSLGIGVDIAVGQVLDPLDDMAERLSSVLVTAIVSLGLQKMVMEIGVLVSFKAAAAILLLLLIPLWYPAKGKAQALIIPIVTATLLLIILRLFLPLSSFAANSLYQNLMVDDIERAKQKLTVISRSSKELETVQTKEETGVISSLTANAGQRISKITELLSSISKNMEEYIQALLTLTVIYVSLFLLQVIVIPLLMFWLMLQSGRLSMKMVFGPAAANIATAVPQTEQQTGVA